jgi:heptosyltransferase-1
MHVLIVKMSSMGDIIHTLPAVSDAVKALPEIEFDWVAEEAFIEIPTWHKNVNQVIPIALRRWRKQVVRTLQQGEVQQFYKRLRLHRYDKVIDAQGSIKSAVTTRLSRGYRLGGDKNSVREVFADLAYQKKFSVPRKQHAINRLRQLFSYALQYPLPETPPCYDIDKSRLPRISMALPKNYLVFVPNASWPAKCWPEASWSLLLEKTAQEGLPIFIPWGNAEEKKRAMRICANKQHVTVLPHLSLSEIASLFSQASAAVCVDTGLSHLAAALETPTITLYGPTDPKLIGTTGASQIHLQSKYFSGVDNQLDIPVDQVWQTLSQVLNGQY